MVSLQASHSQEEGKVIPNLNPFSSKKRKWQDEVDEASKRDEEEEDYLMNNNISKDIKEPKSLWKKKQLASDADDDNHVLVEAPLPLEWQRCLDIKSGQIHFYNTRTHKRTSKDPRSTTSPTTSEPQYASASSSSPLSLDLELNLNILTNSNVYNSSNLQLPPWISPDVDRRDEMVAAVCGKCHMLVVMCKESPLCPNCKFVHAPSKP